MKFAYPGVRAEARGRKETDIDHAYTELLAWMQINGESSRQPSVSRPVDQWFLELKVT